MVCELQLLACRKALRCFLGAVVELLGTIDLRPPDAPAVLLWLEIPKFSSGAIRESLCAEAEHEVDAARERERGAPGLRGLPRGASARIGGA